MDIAARWALSLSVLIAGLGCGGNDDDDLDRYFATTPYGVASCDQADARLEGRREVRLYSNGAVEVAAHSAALQRYYRRYGLTFFTMAAPKSIDQSYALDTNLTALSAALTRAFPGVDLNDEQALMRDPALYDRILKFVANFMLRPMIDFARAHGDAGTAVTNFVVMPQLIRPGGADILPMGAILGGLAAKLS